MVHRGVVGSRTLIFPHRQWQSIYSRVWRFVECNPTEDSVVVIMLLVGISKFSRSRNIERNPIQVQPYGNVHLMLLWQLFHKFIMDIDAAPFSLACFFGTSCWIECSAGISSGCIFLMCFFVLPSALLFTKKFTHWHLLVCHPNCNNMEYRDFLSLECRTLAEYLISNTSCEPSVVNYDGDKISLQVHYRNRIHLKLYFH